MFHTVGSEIAILKSMDWSVVDIAVIMIETNFPEDHAALKYAHSDMCTVFPFLFVFKTVIFVMLFQRKSEHIAVVLSFFLKTMKPNHLRASALWAHPFVSKWHIHESALRADGAMAKSHKRSTADRDRISSCSLKIMTRKKQ